MSAGSWVRCDGCGDEVSDDLLSPEQLRSALEAERGWTCDNVQGDRCRACATVLAGAR